MMRRLGERPDPNRSYWRRPGAYGIILSGNTALLTMSYEHEASPQLPGGGIDPGEGPLQALHRETLEETGWRIAVERRLGCYQRFSYLPEYGKWAQKICSVYLCRPIIKISEPTEAYHMPLWAPLESLSELLIDPTQGQFVSDHIEA